MLPKIKTIINVVGITGGSLLGLVLLTNSAYAAKLYIIPQGIDIVENETITAEIRLDTEGETINAMEIKGALDGDSAILIDINESGSLLKVFIEEPSAENNRFSIIGGVPGGFNGVGVVARLNIQGKTPGNTSLVFDRNSRVLLNSETGDSTTIKFNDAVILVVKQDKNYVKISSRTHPDQSKWYSSNKVNIHWDLENSVEYSYVVTQDPTRNPDETPDRPEGKLTWMGDIELNELKDGIYYFALKKVGSPSVSRYLIKIDSVPPILEDAAITLGTAETDNKDLISFRANDETSGIDRYEIKLDDGNFEPAISPYQVLRPFKEATIQVYDKAGNVSEKKVLREKTEDTTAIIGVVFTIIVMVVLFLLMRGRRKKTEDRN